MKQGPQGIRCDVGFVYDMRIQISGQIIATSAEVTPNGSLARDSPNNALNSGLGIIVIWLEICGGKACFQAAGQYWAWLFKFLNHAESFYCKNFGTIEAEIEHLLELAKDGLHLR